MGFQDGRLGSRLGDGDGLGKNVESELDDAHPTHDLAALVDDFPDDDRDAPDHVQRRRMWPRSAIVAPLLAAAFCVVSILGVGWSTGWSTQWMRGTDSESVLPVAAAATASAPTNDAISTLSASPPTATPPDTAATPSDSPHGDVAELRRQVDTLQLSLQDAQGELEAAGNLKGQVAQLKTENARLTREVSARDKSIADLQSAHDEAVQKLALARALADSLRSDMQQQKEVADARIGDLQHKLKVSANTAVTAPAVEKASFATPGSSSILSRADEERARNSQEPCLVAVLPHGSTPSDFAQELGVPFEIVYVLNKWALTLTPYDPATGSGTDDGRLGAQQRSPVDLPLYVPPDRATYGSASIRRLSDEERRQVDRASFTCKGPQVVQWLAENGLKVDWTR